MEGVNNTVPPLALQVRPNESSREQQPINVPPEDTKKTSSDVEQKPTQNSTTAQGPEKIEVKIDLKKLLSVVNEALDLKQTKLSIDFSEEADRFIYRGIDKETGEVVREYPPEEVIRQIAKFRELAGIVLDAET